MKQMGRQIIIVNEFRKTARYKKSTYKINGIALYQNSQMENKVPFKIVK